MPCDVAARKCHVDNCPCTSPYGHDCICRKTGLTELEEEHNHDPGQERVWKKRVVHNEEGLEVRFEARACSGTCQYVGVVLVERREGVSYGYHDILRRGEAKDRVILKGWAAGVTHSKSCRNKADTNTQQYFLSGPFQVVPLSPADKSGILESGSLSHEEVVEVFAAQGKRRHASAGLR